jgi:hypothetical protein
MSQEAARRLYGEDRWDGVPLFGCFSYVSPVTGRNECCPRFFEAAVFPCLSYGNNVTLMINEPSWNYELCRQLPLGDFGVLATVGGMFAAFCLWWPFSPLFCALVGHQRLALRTQYFPFEDSKTRWSDVCVGCLCAPCALFQHYEFLIIKKATSTPVVAVQIPVQMTM